MDPAALLAIAAEAAEAAGELLLSRFREPAKGVGRKSSTTDMVSDADRDAEALIRGRLSAARPHDAILGEEAGEIFARIYDVTEFGNFEGENILHPVLTFEQAGKLFKIDPAEIVSLVQDAKHNHRNRVRARGTLGERGSARVSARPGGSGGPGGSGAPG